jgi:subtilisin family serine protease
MENIYLVSSKALDFEPFTELTPLISTEKKRQSQINAIREEIANGLAETALQRIFARLGISYNPETDLLPILGLRLVRMTDEQATKLNEALDYLPFIEVHPDFLMEMIYPHSPPAEVSTKPESLWHLDSEGIGLLALRQNGFANTGQGVSVAIVDTGVDINHPALKKNGASKIIRSYGLSDGSLITIPPIKLPKPAQISGHGTFVAGLIAGASVGVAPDVSIINIMIGNDGSLFASGFGKALENLVQTEREVQVINISMGRLGKDEGLRTPLMTLLNRGILPVIAIGNEGFSNGSRSPGSYDELLSVGAYTINQSVPGWSSYIDARTHRGPDLAAPGVDIWSLKDTGFAPGSATSYATPIVSGVAALLFKACPKLKAKDIARLLTNNCTPGMSVPSERQGKGLFKLNLSMFQPPCNQS